MLRRFSIHHRISYMNLCFITSNIRFDNPDDGLNAWPHRKSLLAQTLLAHSPDIIATQEGRFHQLKEFGVMSLAILSKLVATRKQEDIAIILHVLLVLTDCKQWPICQGSPHTLVVSSLRATQTDLRRRIQGPASATNDHDHGLCQLRQSSLQ